MQENHEIGSRFRLFANCIPVRGARRSTICDLQRHALHLIPNGLYDILIEHRGESLDELCQFYGEDARETLQEYFTFLVEKELGLWTKHPERLPDVDLAFDAPGVLDAAIIDVSEQSKHNYQHIVQELDSLGCRYMQLRCFTSVEHVEIEAVFAAIASSRLRGLELTIRYSPALTESRLFDWCEQHQRLVSILVHGADRTALVLSPVLEVPIRYIVREIASAAQCGYVHPSYFAINLKSFTEAIHFNSCLNRKASINQQGQVCNCPAMSRTFGQFEDVSLREVVSGSDFRKVWAVRKDDIEICRDCEFRYVCTDCRAHISDQTNLLSKPKWCGYDPYTANWQPVEVSAEPGD